MATHGGPITITDVIGCGPGVAKSSAYRDLAVLEGAGVLQRIASEDDLGHFELADELVGHHHHHLHCTVCGEIDDVAATPALQRALSRACAEAAEGAGFVATTPRFDIVGRCPRCA